MSWRAGPTKPGIPPTLPHRGSWRQEAKESTCLGQPSLHHLEMLAPPQRAAFPRAKEIPKAVASGRKQGRRSGSPPSATRLKCPPMALELPKPRSDPEPRPPPPRAFPLPPPPSRKASGDKGLFPLTPWRQPGRARTRTPPREAQDPSQSSADDLGRQMARRMGRQIEAPAPCQDDTQKYIPVITGCQRCVSARCRVCFWTLCEFGRLSFFPLP